MPFEIQPLKTSDSWRRQCQCSTYILFYPKETLILNKMAAHMLTGKEQAMSGHLPENVLSANLSRRLLFPTPVVKNTFK